MKKFLIFFVGLAAQTLFADYDIETAGLVTDVNNAQKTITITTVYDAPMRIQILPNTEIDLDDCGLFGLYDGFGSFRDLKVGIFVEVELFSSSSLTSGKGIARKVDISCKGNAY